MVIWQVDTSTDYLALAFANDHEARTVLDYVDGKLSKWQPVYVSYDTDVYDYTDERHERIPSFLRFSGSIVCNEKTMSIIEDFIDGYAEFLPLMSNTIRETQYYLLYPTEILDCLDNELTEFARTRSGYITGIRRHAFRLDCIGDTPIFRLPVAGSLWGWPYVNDRFKQLVEDNNLTGLEFRKVWEG